MTPRPGLWGGLVMAALSLSLAPAARGDDLHQLWDQRCGGCHGHAGAFARKVLVVVDGRLSDRRGRDVVAFLANHNGGYSPEHIAAIATMLRAQAETPELFRQLCSECHETAAQVARTLLTVEDGEVRGRQSHRPLADILRQHGAVKEDQVAPLVDALSRVVGEVRHR